jgi:hypothetical protein
VAIVVWDAATDNLIAIALAITAGTFLLALAYLGWSTWLTRRRDRMASSDMGPDAA